MTFEESLTRFTVGVQVNEKFGNDRHNNDFVRYLMMKDKKCWNFTRNLNQRKKEEWG